MLHSLRFIDDLSEPVDTAVSVTAVGQLQQGTDLFTSTFPKHESKLSERTPFGVGVRWAARRHSA